MYIGWLMIMRMTCDVYRVVGDNADDVCTCDVYRVVGDNADAV